MCFLRDDESEMINNNMSLAIKEKVDKLNYSDVRSFCTSKNIA